MSFTQSFPKYHKFCPVSYETQQELNTSQMDAMCWNLAEILGLESLRDLPAYKGVAFLNLHSSTELS